MPLETQSLLTFSFTVELTIIQQWFPEVDKFVQMAVACSTSGKPSASPLGTFYLPCAFSLQTDSCPDPWASFCAALCRGCSDCSVDFILRCCTQCSSVLPASLGWTDGVRGETVPALSYISYILYFLTCMFIDWMGHKCFVKKCMVCVCVYVCDCRQFSTCAQVPQNNDSQTKYFMKNT